MMMKVGVRQAGKVGIIDVSGKFILGEAEKSVREAVASLLDADFKRILVNLSKVELIDSSGIGELMAARFRAAKQDAMCHLVRPKKDLAFQPMMIAAMERVFQIFDSESDALGSF